MMNSLKVQILALAVLVGIEDNSYSQTTTVQLPTFRQFGVSTTVLVPDRGRTYLGGVNSSTRASSRFGFGVPGLGNRGYGHFHSAGGVSMSATIIDHDEIDRALLAEAARRRGDKFDIYGRPITDAPARVPDYVGIRPPSLESRSKVQTRVEDSEIGIEELKGQELAATYIRRAREAESKGEFQAASIFYGKVFSTGDASQIILANKQLKRLASRHSRTR